ncbi:hypothetical protein KAR91_37535 [Candidatus Pacearchaeota archaeon]|nr:hypothetical protein [Candidatus Pacearchaeota archaeon]
MTSCCDSSISEMEETREEVFQELKDLPVGSKDRSIAHKTIASLTGLIDYHRQRLGKKKPKRNYEHL